MSCLPVPTRGHLTFYKLGKHAERLTFRLTNNIILGRAYVKDNKLFFLKKAILDITFLIVFENSLGPEGRHENTVATIGELIEKPSLSTV